MFKSQEPPRLWARTPHRNSAGPSHPTFYVSQIPCLSNICNYSKAKKPLDDGLEHPVETQQTHANLLPSPDSKPLKNCSYSKSQEAPRPWARTPYRNSAGPSQPSTISNFNASQTTATIQEPRGPIDPGLEHPIETQQAQANLLQFPKSIPLKNLQ